MVGVAASRECSEIESAACGFMVISHHGHVPRAGIADDVDLNTLGARRMLRERACDDSILEYISGSKVSASLLKGGAFMVRLQGRNWPFRMRAGKRDHYPLPREVHCKVPIPGAKGGAPQDSGRSHDRPAQNRHDVDRGRLIQSLHDFACDALARDATATRYTVRHQVFVGKLLEGVCNSGIYNGCKFDLTYRGAMATIPSGHHHAGNVIRWNTFLKHDPPFDWTCKGFEMTRRSSKTGCHQYQFQVE